MDIIHLSAPLRSLGHASAIALGLLALPLLPGMASANDRSGQVLLVPGSSGAVTADSGTGGADDPPGHDANDDNGVDPAGHDANDDNGDPAEHDANDDNGVDPAGHDANDDHGGANGNSGSGNGGSANSGHGGDDHGGSSGGGNSGSQH